ncbi:hypothetical protein ACN38_g10949 [Penicillium nordicum]|uniref:Uncharacterized protein n=1 Tax=Penicillium nordicum TaxID=229535 RepID=A0A0M9WB67_9EURO|nr:hypothetical protein ACN38_g10949 [Penicillium nordicum]
MLLLLEYVVGPLLAAITAWHSIAYYRSVLQPAPGLASCTLGQKTIISEHYPQIDHIPIYIYIVYDMKIRSDRNYSGTVS